MGKTKIFEAMAPPREGRWIVLPRLRFLRGQTLPVRIEVPDMGHRAWVLRWQIEAPEEWAFTAEGTEVPGLLLVQFSPTDPGQRMRAASLPIEMMVRYLGTGARTLKAAVELGRTEPAPTAADR